MPSENLGGSHQAVLNENRNENRPWFSASGVRTAQHWFFHSDFFLGKLQLISFIILVGFQKSGTGVYLHNPINT
jgi:hypothetical protein